MKILIKLSFVLMSINCYGQQLSPGSILFSDGIGRANYRVDNDPENDLSFLSLAPKVGLSIPVIPSLHAYTSFQYFRLSGDLVEPYNSSIASLGFRYYLKFMDTVKSSDPYPIKVLKKRFSFYLDASYGYKFNEVNPENNRYKHIGEGLGAGSGFQFYITPWLSMSRTYSFFRQGPYYGGRYGLVKFGYFSIHKSLLYWPENESLWSVLRNRRLRRSKSLFEVPKGATQLEFAYGYAPDRIVNDDTEEIEGWEHPMFYRLGLHYSLNSKIDIGGSMQIIDAIGSIPERSGRRDQYYALIASGQYSPFPFKGRFCPVIKAHVKYTNYTYFYDIGHKKEERLYAGFAPQLRFYASHRILLNASMNIFLTTDRDRNTLANNYPEVAVSLLSDTR